MKTSFVQLFLLGTLCVANASVATASAPFPETRPDRNMSTEFEGIWKGKLTVGTPIPNVCKNGVGTPKNLTLRMCVATNPDDGIDELTGRARFKRRYRLLQRNARFRRIFRRNRLRASIATNGTDNPGGTPATGAFIYFQRRLQNDNSRHGNIVANIAESDATELDENGNPIFLAGDLVVSLGNCISGVLKKVATNPAC